GDAGNEVGRFNLYGAWVSEYKGPEFNATSSGQLAFESIVIQYDWFEFVPGGALAGLLQKGLAKVGL
ncbi:MAG: phage tail protein, partial [Deltaproteobacteria bacterium]|nr:phage tail protein [Deltaproteobacteria bacterium]